MTISFIDTRKNRGLKLSFDTIDKVIENVQKLLPCGGFEYGKHITVLLFSKGKTIDFTLEQKEVKNLKSPCT